VRAGEFGPEPHPWLGAAQHLHVLVAPCLVFTLGLIVRGHLWPKLDRTLEGRNTGLGATFLIAPMVASGYGIQVVTSPAWRVVFAWAHGLSAGFFLAAYLGHLIGRARQPTSPSVVEGQPSRAAIADS
jgi:hypothetical protein